MKKTAIVTSLVLATTFGASAAFAEQTGKEKSKAFSFFSGGAVVGALAGGPIGMLIGAVGSSLWHDQDTKQEKKMGIKITQNQQEIYQLEQELAVRNSYINDLKSSTEHNLAFRVMFSTGADNLTGEDLDRINTLAIYLKDNQELNIRLDGHTDPRGTEEYNNVLSEERALSVATALKKRGIDDNRIEIFSHGSNKSKSVIGDYEHYSFDRRVDIEIIPSTNNNVASLK